MFKKRNFILTNLHINDCCKLSGMFQETMPVIVVFLWIVIYRVDRVLVAVRSVFKWYCHIVRQFKYHLRVNFSFRSFSNLRNVGSDPGTRETRLNDQQRDSVLLLQRLLHANVTLNDSPLSGMITASGEYGYRDTACRNRWITKINRTPRYTSLRRLRYDLIYPNISAPRWFAARGHVPRSDCTFV